MLSPTSLVLLFAISHAVTNARAATAPSPCTVKAWVRADDLSPNAISHGELKVKLIQPCPNTVKSVTLRLRLDEFAEESTVSNQTTSGEFWDWQGDAPMAEWITTKHKRTAWKIEKTLTADGTLEGQDWGSGVVFPFSVASPNVNFPAAIHPLIFSGPSTDTHRSVFGLSYRYTALVAVTGPNGSPTKEVEVPAGFTAFRPAPIVTDAVDPREVTVEAIGKRDRWSSCVEEGKGAEEDEDAWRKDVKKMTLRVKLPPGGYLVQGGESDVAVTVVGGGNADSLTYTTVLGYLNQGVALTSATGNGNDCPDDDDDGPRSFLNRHSFHFKEIYADMWRPTPGDCERIQRPITQPLRVTVPASFPRTAPAIRDPTSDAPFRIEAWLAIMVTEFYDSPHMSSLEDGGAYLTGERRKAPATEVGWEFGACDRSHYHQRSYTARVPVSIVGAPGDTSHDEHAFHYMHNEGRVRIMSGHLSSPTGISFDIADPVSVRDTATVPAAIQGGGRDVFGGFGSRDTIDAKAGQYVGALWQSRLHGPRASPASVKHQVTSDQVILQV